MPTLRFLALDALWASEWVKRKRERHLLPPRMSIQSQSPDLYDEVAVEKDVAIRMGVGIRLYSDLCRPKAEGGFPVILTRLPYGKGESYCHLPPVGDSGQEGVRLRRLGRQGQMVVGRQVGAVVKAGHLVCVEIFSSSFNRFDRNLNAGGPLGRAADFDTANQQVFHKAECPSRITVPINPRQNQEEGNAQ